MLDSCDRVFKEWDLSCRAMCDGRQTLLVRKGGIREDGGVFVLDDTEFWLMPTFDHQNANMLQPNYVEELKRLGDANPNPDIVTIRGYAIVDAGVLVPGQIVSSYRPLIGSVEYIGTVLCC